MIFNVDTSGALDLQNSQAMSPTPTGNRGRGFLGWLGNNYQGVSEAALNIACIFNPDKCPRTGGGTTVVQQPQQQSSGPSIYIILAVIVTVAILLIIFLKK